MLCNSSGEKIHQRLTLSSMNVLSFFSFENSTHSRFSHSLPSSADGMKGKIQTRISKLFCIDFRFIIFTQLCSYLLNIVSHPSNFSDNIAANPSLYNTTYLHKKHPKSLPSMRQTMLFFNFLSHNLVHCPISTFITYARKPFLA